MASGAQSRLHDFYWSHAARIGPLADTIEKRGEGHILDAAPSTTITLAKADRRPHGARRLLNLLYRSHKKKSRNGSRPWRLSHRHDNERLSVGPRILKRERTSDPCYRSSIIWTHNTLCLRLRINTKAFNKINYLEYDLPTLKRRFIIDCKSLFFFSFNNLVDFRLLYESILSHIMLKINKLCRNNS